MKLVIDIDENLYTKLFSDGRYDAVDMLKICASVKKGKALPKGHGDLKDANNFFNDELDAKLAECKVEQNIFKDVVHVKDIIKYAPTIIEADRGNKDE